MYCAITLFLIVLRSSSLLTEARSLETEMPANCAGQTYCTEKSKDYPQQIFDALLGKIDAKDTNIKTTNTDLPETRQGATFLDGCRSSLKDGRIYEIVDVNGDLRYVAQMEGRFLQDLDINVCEEPGRLNYTESLGSITEFANLSCVQLTVDYNFLVLKQDMTGLELAQAKGGIPVSCMCRVLQSAFQCDAEDYS